MENTTITKQPLTGKVGALIVAAAWVAVVPMMIFGNPRGHDFDLQIPGWLEAEHQLSQGVLFPLWTAGANHGFGAPFFVFYPPLSRALGATLGLLLPWALAPGCYTWLALIAAGLGMYTLASEWLRQRDSACAAVLYVLNPYLLLTIYKRSDYAELLGSALFPLLIWSAIRVVHQDKAGIVRLAAVFAAIWITDLPAAVIASYSVAGLLVLGALVYRSSRPILWGALAIITGFGSIAFFLLPAAWERQWVNINQAVKFVWMPEHNFLFDHSNIAQYVGFNRGLSWFATVVIIITVLAAVWGRELRRRYPQDWRLLAIFGALAALMMFPPALVLYKFLPELHYVQFPWRWMSPVCVVYALFTGAAIAQARNKALLWSAMAVIIVAMAATIVRTTWWDPGNRYLHELLADMPRHLENNGATWSSPLGSQPSKLDWAAPDVAVANTGAQTSEPAQVNIEGWSANRKVFSIQSATPVLVALKLLNYPGWHAQVNRHPVSLSTDSETGQMLLELPAGSSQVQISFGMTADRKLGFAISVITALGLLVFALRRAKANPASQPSWEERNSASSETPHSMALASVSAKHD